MKKRSEVWAILLSALLLAAALLGAGELLLPWQDYNGTDWRCYAREPENTLDLLYVGSSLVFCDVDPVKIYADSGLTGFVVAGPEQSMAISYYYVREACRTQKPKAVFVELNGMFASPAETFTTSDIAFMPRGLNRLGASLFAARAQDLPGLLFPVLKYHDYWTSLTPALLTQKRQLTSEPLAGYRALDEQSPFTGVTLRDDYGEGYAQNLRGLKRLAAYCERERIALYLFDSPAGYTAAPELKARLREALSDTPAVRWLDLSGEEARAAIGLDPNTDWADGLHLNRHGAEKLSAWLADFLLREGYTPTTLADAALWQWRLSEHG